MHRAAKMMMFSCVGGGVMPYVTDGLTLCLDGEYVNGLKRVSQSEWDGTIHDLAGGNMFYDETGKLNLFYDPAKKEYGWKADESAVSSGYVRTNSVQLDTTGNAYTIEAVAYGEPDKIIQNGGDSSFMNGRFNVAFMRGNIGNPRAGQVRFRINANTVRRNHMFWNSTYGLQRSQFRFVCTDISDLANKTSFYYNDVLQTLSQTYDASSADVKTVNFGSTYSTAKIHVNSFRVYNRVLTPEEVAFNYSIDKQRFGL